MLSAALAIVGTDYAHAQRVEVQASAYYQPPILPIQFNIDSSGRLSITAAGVFVTPFGTFGVGGGISAAPRSQHNTCFIVRRRGRESVYCIGTSGRLRLTTVGTSVVDISGYPGRPNVYLIDVLRERGHFSVQFVPSPGANELARIRMSLLQHIYLRRDGAIVVDGAGDGDDVYSRAAVRRAALYEAESAYHFSSYFVMVSRGANGAYHFRRWPLDRQGTLEARWFLQMFVNLAPGTPRYERPVERFGHHGRVAFYADGSVFNGLHLYYGAHIAGLQISTYDPNTVSVRIKPQFAREEAQAMFGTPSVTLSSPAEAVRLVRRYRHHFGPRQ